MGLAGALTAAQMGGEIFSGVASNKAAKVQAALYKAQGDIHLAEALQSAKQKAEEVTKFQASQGHAYLSSGVTLEGTPAIAMEETRQKGQQEVDALVKRGAALKQFYALQAQQAKKNGRAALLAGVFGAATTGLSGALRTSKAGLKAANQFPINIPPSPGMAGTLNPFGY